MAKHNNLVDKIVLEALRISKELGINPVQLTKYQFLKHTDKFKEWDLRKVGGLTSILKSYFPQEDKDFKTIEENRSTTRYINKLERELGRIELYRQNLLKDVSNKVSKVERRPLILNPKETKAYFKSVSRPAKNDLAGRSICTLWSDHHIGVNIRKDEVGDINEYDYKIAARRLGMLCEQIALYKEERRSQHQELVIFLAGDNIHGVIHNQESTALLTNQVVAASNYYIDAVEYLKQFFPKVRVECQPGNHGRPMHKMSKDRAVQDKWDSYENYVFMSLSAAFKGDRTVDINVSRSPWSDTVVQGHRIFSTHGDTVVDVGNPGVAVPLSRIEQQVNRINAEQKNQGNKLYEMLCTGHVHHPLITHVGAGFKIVINGCLSGTDPYAQAKGIQSSQPAQVLWETTKKYVQGDTRIIYVADADEEQRYEKIIKPYKGQLKVV